MPESPTLLVAAHGTRSAAGSATTARLVEHIAEARPGLSVELGFLDVASPSLRDALDAADGPLVVVPLLLSAGYHVLSDIPALVAGRDGVVVARHLGADPLIIDALVERLAAVGSDAPARTTLLARVGSSRASAGAEFDLARVGLEARLGRPVSALSLSADVAAQLAGLDRPVEIASYLLAEGGFLDGLRTVAGGQARVADPIGVHPALIALVLARYDEACGSIPG